MDETGGLDARITVQHTLPLQRLIGYQPDGSAIDPDEAGQKAGSKACGCGEKTSTVRQGVDYLIHIVATGNKHIQRFVTGVYFGLIFRPWRVLYTVWRQHDQQLPHAEQALLLIRILKLSVAA